MSYQSKISEVLGNVHNTSVATKILQFMQKVHNNSDERYAVRWFSELLQNTRDCRFENQGVKIKFTVTNDYVTYEHNSKPFRVKDILSLVNQVTSKVDDETTTGKFGTGFMTTMLLSDMVTIESFLKDGEEDYKPFKVEIDRSSETSQGIIDAINNAIEQLRHTDDLPAYNDFKQENYNTKFTYKLNTDRAKKSAITGIENLIITAPYIFAFSPEFESIEINCNTDSYCVNTTIERVDVKRIHSLVNCHSCIINGEKKEILVYDRNNIQLAAPVEDKIVLGINSKVPRLFISFPLVGSEKFPFPIVLNSNELLPNEPRSNIALQDNESSKDSVHNKNIVNTAISFYREFLDILIINKFDGLNNFVSLPPQEYFSEHSEEFVKTSIYSALRDAIMIRDIIKCNDGYLHHLSDKELFLVKGTCKTEIKELLSSLKDVLYPEEPENWVEVLKGYNLAGENFITLERLFEWVDTGQLSFKNGTDIVAWLNKLYNLGKKDSNLSLKISVGEFRCIPTQLCTSDYLSTRSLAEVEFDKGISEAFKNLYEDVLEVDLRNKLIHKDFNLSPTEMFNTADASYLASKVAKEIDFRNINSNMVKVAVGVILSSKFDLFKSLAERTVVKKNAKNYEGLREISDVDLLTFGRYVLLAILHKGFANCVQVNAVFDSLEVERDDWEFFNELLKAVGEYIDKTYYWEYNLLPVYTGKLVGLNVCSLIDFDDEIIQDALFQVKPELKNTTVLKEVQVDKLGVAKLTLEQACNHINNYFVSIFEGANKKDLNDLSDDINTAAMSVFEWIENHPGQAHYFSYLSDENNRMRLLNIQKVRQLNEKSKAADLFLEKHGCTEFEELDKKLSTLEGFIECFKKLGINVEDISPEELLEMIGKDNEPVFEEVKIGNYFGNSEVNIKTSDLPIEFVNYWLKDRLEDFKKIIGETGEKLAYEEILSKMNTDGYTVTSRKGHTTTLIKDNKKVNVILMNDIYDNNEGYDIKIEGEDWTHYVEVKTSTVTSVMQDTVKLTKSQIRKYSKELDNYTVLKVDVLFDNWYASAEGDPTKFELLYGKIRKAYTNIPKCIGNGDLIVTSDSIFGLH